MRKRIIGVLIYFILVHFTTLFITKLIKTESGGIAEHSTYSVLAQALIFIVAMYVLIRMLRLDFKYDVTKLLKGKHTKRYTFWLISGFVVALVVQLVVVNIENHIFGVTGDMETKTKTLEMIQSNFLTVLIPVILVPAFEELVFRRVIFTALHEKYAFVLASIVSSGIFAIFHGSFVHFTTFFLVGIVLSFVYKKTDNIIIPMVLHAMLNSIPVILLFI